MRPFLTAWHPLPQQRMKIFLGVPRLATGDGPGRAVAALHAIMGSIAACKRMLWYRSERIFPRTCAVSHPLAVWKARKTGESDLPAAPFCAFYSTLSILPAKVNAKKRKKQNSDCGSVDTGVETAAPPLTAHRAGQLFPRAEISASFAG